MSKKGFKENYKNYTFTVYMHIAPNNKKYVGITHKKVQHRWHKNGSGYNTNEHFWRAIQKYGWDNFEHLIFAEGIRYEDACELEIALIKQYKTNDEHFGYNKSTGGDLSAIGTTYTDEQRKRYSLSKMGAKNPQYGKPAWNRGKPMSEESRQKCVESHKGQVAWNKGIPLSEERKKHLHDINIGKVYINNGIVEKCINKDELDHYINMGYKRGYLVNRRTKYKKWTKNKKVED